LYMSAGATSEVSEASSDIEEHTASSVDSSTGRGDDSGGITDTNILEGGVASGVVVGSTTGSDSELEEDGTTGFWVILYSLLLFGLLIGVVLGQLFVLTDLLGNSSGSNEEANERARLSRNIAPANKNYV
jgi:hypothetical protein